MWEEAWVAPGLFLKDHDLHTVNNNVQLHHVSNLLSTLGNLNRLLLSRLFTQNILDKSLLYPLPPSVFVPLPDSCLCTGNKTWLFSISNVYGILNHNLDDESSFQWDKIWKLQVPERVHNFMWKIWHKCLITNEFLNNLQPRNNNYDLCGSQPETIMHIIRDCTLPKTFGIN